MNWSKLFKGVGNVLGFVNPLLGVGANILGGVLGSNGQKDTNKMNYKINQENNAFNERMMDKQNLWNQQQVQDAREYEKPANELARLKEAGINPLTQSFSNSQVNPVGSSPATAAPSSGMLNPDVSMAEALMNTSNSMAQTALLHEQAKNIATDTKQKESAIEGMDVQTALTKGLSSGLIDYQNVQVALGRADVKLKGAELGEVGKRIELMNHQIEVLDETVQNLKSQELLNEQNVERLRNMDLMDFKRFLLDSELADAQMKHWSNEDFANIKRATAELLNAFTNRKEAEARIRLYGTQGTLNLSLAGLYDTQNKSVGVSTQWDTKMLSLYYPMQKSMVDDYLEMHSFNKYTDAGLKILGGINNTLNSLAGMKNAFAPALRSFKNTSTSTSTNTNYNYSVGWDE